LKRQKSNETVPHTSRESKKVAGESAERVTERKNTLPEKKPTSKSVHLTVPQSNKRHKHRSGPVYHGNDDNLSQENKRHSRHGRHHATLKTEEADSDTKQSRKIEHTESSTETIEDKEIITEKLEIVVINPQKNQDSSEPTSKENLELKVEVEEPDKTSRKKEHNETQEQTLPTEHDSNK